MKMNKQVMPPPEGVENSQATYSLPPLAVHNLSLSYSGKMILQNIDFTLEAGTATAILGPNGAGKSSLIKGILGLTPCVKETNICFFGGNLQQHRAKIAYLPQRAEVDWQFPVTAADVVAMGLYHKRRFWQLLSRRHYQLALHYLEQLGLADLADSPLHALSGGQQQRVFLARALAQQPTILIMDEPLAGIDYPSAEIFAKILQELRQKNVTILAVHHDLANLKRFFTHALLLNHHLLAKGEVEQVATWENFQQLYGLTSSFSAADLLSQNTADRLPSAVRQPHAPQEEK